MQRYLIVVMGPTAIGKTTMSIALARALHTEILSADSRQFYKETRIGTAIPSQEELQQVPHHFIQHQSICDTYDVGDYEKDALAKLDEIFHTRQLALLVGGSGLYVKAVCEGLDHFPTVNPHIRNALNQRLITDGMPSLQEQLKAIDPEYAQVVDLQNPRRLIRALEVYLESGKPYSYFLNQPKAKRIFTPLKIGLTAPREVIYQRIEMRIDQMLNNGLLEEVKKLYPLRHLNALNTIGYKELFRYLSKECSLDTAVAEIKKNTRRFAKRQLTWFKKEKSITWFAYDTPPETILSFIEQKTA